MEPFTSKTTDKQKQNINKKGTLQLESFINEISLYKKTQTNITNKINRKFKTMLIWSLFEKNNMIFKTFRRVNLKELKNRLSIDGKSSTVVGFTPDYKGINPSKPIKPYNYISEFLYKQREIIQNKYPSLYKFYLQTLTKPRIVFGGGYDSSSDHLAKIFKSNPTNKTEQEILQILQLSNFKWFNTPKVTFEDPEEIYYSTNYNPKSKSGHYTSKLLKSSKRIQTVTTSLHSSLKIFDLIKTQPFQNYYLWEILGREKDIKLTMDNEYKEVSARVVMSTEEPATLLLCHFAQKMTSALNTVENKFDVKEKFSFNKYYKYEDYNNKYDYYLDADWSNFDANVDSIFIKIAMSIMLSEISDVNKEHTRISFYIMSSMITKFILVPPGIVVKCDKGIPSGSPFTTLCNCYINIIYWSLIGYEIYGDKYADNMELTVYGDDALVWFKHNDKLFDIDSIVKNIGIKSESLVPRLFPCKLQTELNEKPDFLKRQFNLFEVKWNRNKMFERLLYQTENRDLIFQYQLFKSYIETAPYDDEIVLLFNDFCSYITKTYNDKLDQQTIDEISEINKLINNCKQNYGHETLFKPNEGYLTEIKLAKYSYARLREDYIKNSNYQRIKQSEIDLLFMLGIPNIFINELYRENVNQILNKQQIFIKQLNFINIRSPAEKAVLLFNEWLKPP